jgi:hypothetical protein
MSLGMQSDVSECSAACESAALALAALHPRRSLLSC